VAQNSEDSRSLYFLFIYEKLKTEYREDRCSRKLWIYIPEAPGSNLGLGTEYSDSKFSSFS
jgi:hypothetical protein